MDNDKRESKKARNIFEGICEEIKNVSDMKNVQDDSKLSKRASEIEIKLEKAQLTIKQVNDEIAIIEKRIVEFISEKAVLLKLQ